MDKMSQKERSTWLGFVKGKLHVPKGKGNTIVGSEQMLMEIAHVHEKINHFIQLISELLESWKSTLKDLSHEFEERLILIHKEQIDKWEKEIQEVRLLGASNEETSAVLHDAGCLPQNVPGQS